MIEVAKVLIVVERTTDDELVGNIEASILGDVAIAEWSSLHKETRHPNRLGGVRFQEGQQLDHRPPRVDDVLDDENILASKRLKALNANHLNAVRRGLVLVALEANELHAYLLRLVGHLVRQIHHSVSIEAADLLEEVIEEEIASLEDAESREGLVCEVDGYVNGHSLDSVLYESTRDEDILQVLGQIGCDAQGLEWVAVKVVWNHNGRTVSFLM